MKLTQKDIINFQGYDFEITTRNGRDIERFYLDSTTNNRIVFSTVLYHGKSEKDAMEHFMEYFTPKKTWYIFGENELRYVEG